jgi:hypothetical protein
MECFDIMRFRFWEKISRINYHHFGWSWMFFGCFGDVFRMFRRCFLDVSEMFFGWSWDYPNLAMHGNYPRLNGVPSWILDVCHNCDTRPFCFWRFLLELFVVKGERKENKLPLYYRYRWFLRLDLTVHTYKQGQGRDCMCVQYAPQSLLKYYNQMVMNNNSITLLSILLLHISLLYYID